MKFSRNILVVCFLVATSLPAFSQKFLSRPYTEWSTDDAKKIVSESAWAKTYSSIESGARSSAQSVGRNQRDTVNGGGGRPGSVAQSMGNLPVVIRLHSSAYVRQALVRLQQLDAKYDKMNADQKTTFDAAKKGFLDCVVCNNYYVVTLTKYTDSSGESVNEGIFQAMKLEDMQGKVSLTNEKGEKRELVQFTPPKSAGDSAIFFFKRTDDSGKPLITNDTKDLHFVFSGEFIQSDKRYGGLYPKRFEFDVAKIIVDEKVQF